VTRKKTGKETAHTYTYNAYGDVETQDGTRFTYGDVSGQITSETTKLTKNKDVVRIMLMTVPTISPPLM